MSQTEFADTALPILLGMVGVWFVLIKLLLNRLEQDHAKKYESMGRPSLFVRNNVTTGWATLRFIVGREHRPLNDRYLSNLSDFMLVFLGIYAALFVGLAVLGR